MGGRGTAPEGPLAPHPARRFPRTSGLGLGRRRPQNRRLQGGGGRREPGGVSARSPARRRQRWPLATAAPPGCDRRHRGNCPARCACGDGGADRIAESGPAPREAPGEVSATPLWRHGEGVRRARDGSARAAAKPWQSDSRTLICQDFVVAPVRVSVATVCHCLGQTCYVAPGECAMPRLGRPRPQLRPGSANCGATSINLRPDLGRLFLAQREACCISPTAPDCSKPIAPPPPSDRPRFAAAGPTADWPGRRLPAICRPPLARRPPSAARPPTAAPWPPAGPHPSAPPQTQPR